MLLLIFYLGMSAAAQLPIQAGLFTINTLPNIRTTESQLVPSQYSEVQTIPPTVVNTGHTHNHINLDVNQVPVIPVTNILPPLTHISHGVVGATNTKDRFNDLTFTNNGQVTSTFNDFKRVPVGLKTHETVRYTTNQNNFVPQQVQYTEVVNTGTRLSDAPQAPPPIPIISLNIQPNSGDGSYSYSYETGNGIKSEESGYLKQLGNDPEKAGTAARGSYSYTDPDGNLLSVKYTADENGFVAEGDHFPTPPPIPQEIYRALEKSAAAQVSQGLDVSPAYRLFLGNRHYQPINYRQTQSLFFRPNNFIV